MTVKTQLKPVKIPGFVERFGLINWDGINRVETDPTEDSPVDAPVDAVADPVAPVVEDKGGGDNTLHESLVKERKLRAQYEKDAKRLKKLEEMLGSSDPERLLEYKQSLDRLQKLEDEKAQLKAEIEAEFERKNQESLEVERQQSRKLQQELENIKLQNECRTDYINADGIPEDFDDFFEMIKKDIRKDQQGKYRIHRDGETLYLNNEPWLEDDDPRKGKPYSIADYMEANRRGKLGRARSRFFEPINKSSGSGVSGGGFAAGSEKPKNPQEMRKWARQQRKSGF